MVVVNRSGTVISANTGSRLLGQDYLRFLERYPCWPALVGRELAEQARSLLEGRQSHFSHEHACAHAAGNRVLRVEGHRMTGVEGPLVVLVHEDISGEKSDERLARRAQFTLNQAADAIFWVGEDGRFEYVNEEGCRLLGYERREILGMKVWDVDTGLTESNWRVAWERARKESVLRLTTTCRTRDGRTVPVEVTVNHLSADGREFHCTFVRDVSSRKLLEDQFRQAQKLEAVGRLAGGVAHDFNNLLTVINGYSDLLLERAPADGADRELLKEIHDAGRRAVGLTRQLLAFSRKQPVQPVVLDLKTLLAQMSKMLQRLLGEDIRIDLRGAGGPAMMRADPGQIEQVVMNLSVNARDAMRSGGTLTLDTEAVELGAEEGAAFGGLSPGPYVRLTVSDTGCGMDEEVRSHLFEPFFTTKEPGKGTGLGLSTVYGIVAQAGGRITCESEAGRGTAFTLLFPRCEGAAEERNVSASGPRTCGSETILLVEDEDAVRTLARVVLERQGYRVLVAANGVDALERARGHAGSIDLMLTDMVMPLMNGLDLVREFAPAHPEARILLMSGYADPVAGAADLERMGLPHLEKPFLPRILAGRVREVLDRQRPAPVMA